MVSWFVTRNGRYFTYSVVGVIASSAFGLNFMMHGPFLKHWQAVLQLYEEKKPKPVGRELLAKAQSVLQECNLSEEQKQRVSFFTTVGTDVFHAGAYNSPWGAIVGLPQTYNSNAKIRLKDLKIIGKDNMDWEIEGFDLIQTLNLPEAAKKFAIAREIYSANIHSVFEQAAAAFLCCVCPANLCWWHNKKRNALQLPLKKRLLPYAAIYAWALLLYVSIRRPFKHVHDAECDKKAAMLGPEYFQGGVQFYENILERNKVLRSIMGDSGKSRFTEEGNERRMFLVRRLPITARLQELKMIKEECSA